MNDYILLSQSLGNANEALFKLTSYFDDSKSKKSLENYLKKVTKEDILASNAMKDLGISIEGVSDVDLNSI